MKAKEIVGLKGTVNIKIWDKHGNLKEDETIPNQIQNAGKAAVAGLILNDVSVDDFDHIAVGTGSGQAVTATTLSSEITDSGLARASGTGTRTTTSVTNDTAQLVVSWASITGTKAITEAGIFNAASNGDMLAYDDSFSTKNVESGDTLQITWTVQVS